MNINNLKPFGRFCVTLGMIPSSYKESLTYEEQLLWFCNYLETEVIPKYNENVEAINELIVLYNELKSYVDNYFDNLDVQEEINNKLDEMAESGELVEIIGQYLQTAGILSFDTLNDLIEATNIIEGSICKTLGNTSYNDGFGSFYKIRTITSGDVVDNVNIIEIDVSETLIAEKIKTISNNIVNIEDFGCIGDGTTDNATLLQNILDNYTNIYIPDGTFYSSVVLEVKSNTTIDGTGTLKASIDIIGETGSNITFTELETDKITTTDTLSNDELINVYLYDEDNINNSKRQITEIANSSGYLKNNLINFDSTYTVQKINAISNINIKNIKIDGFVHIKYAKNINVDNIKLFTTSSSVAANVLYVRNSYNINITNSNFEFGNESFMDISAGTSNFNIMNCNFNGGNTESDNGTLKLNEVFYSNVNNCNFGSPIKGVVGRTGHYHAIMIDGEWTEQGYNTNHSQFITINNCYASNNYYSSYYVSLGKNIVFNNCNGDLVQIKYSNNVEFNNGVINTLINEVGNTNLLFNNVKVDSIKDGVMSNMKFNSCIIDLIRTKSGTNNIEIYNSTIKDIDSSYNIANTVDKLVVKNCLITNKCQLYGLKNSIIDIISKTNIDLSNISDSYLKFLVIDNVNSATSNINIQNNTFANNNIDYKIIDSALANTPLYNALGYDKLATCHVVGDITSSNNGDANPTIDIVKSNTIPSDGNHIKGEIILNINPAAGGSIGWVCVSSGTPGTWKSIGSIEE